MTNDGYFGEDIAATYDDDIGSNDPDSVQPAVDFLAELATSGRALEFGIGTGRIALPLSKKNIEVHGIDLSKAMLAELSAKPGGTQISVTQGDFATTSCQGSFSLVYLVFNTIMNLTTQNAQVSTFQNAASHLDPGGSFVIEVMVPALQLLPLGETNHVFEFHDDHWGIDTYDVVSQTLESHHLRIRDQKMELSSTPFRYVWPSELDLMARIANMRLKARWGSWKKEPFTNTSRHHISVWEKLAV
ncbi:class I SAM-dependent methyltransferase [Acaryochloris sp. CCMEE 5410]|uniref:class I SAM-dependent DNA methyltransferase n=1 Tax=Acaryochloris sp. CCMEE 5410 TaxID=310037 RepID=UPI00024845D9|nr:class I SAM-dependent methyltransferase [Acaryochloris sp. CCMEE 5410]KAI9129262.1 methyltransferase domain-containing protein [Acaryochloris sp. CCMEE 5410]